MNKERLNNLKIIYTSLPPLIIHVSIGFYVVFSLLIDALNYFFSPLRKIRNKTHCIIGLILMFGYGGYSYYWQGTCDLIQTALIFPAYTICALLVKWLCIKFHEFCYRIRMDMKRYYLFPWGRLYVVVKKSPGDDPGKFYRMVNSEMDLPGAMMFNEDCIVVGNVNQDQDSQNQQ